MTNLPALWKLSQGEGVTAYVLDTGLPDHPDLKKNIVGAVNFVPTEDLNDQNGHSTAVCGVLASIAPLVRLVTVKALNKSGAGDNITIRNSLLFCLNAAKEPTVLPKPDVIVMSLGTTRPFPSLTESLIKQLHLLNVPIICAAGNGGPKERVNYPAAYKECIAVSSVGSAEEVSKFSSRGPQNDFAAPGEDIYTTTLGGQYKLVKGTSFAAPHIAAIICLLLSKHKKQEQETGFNDCKTVEDIRAHLVKHSLDKGKMGKDSEYGYGIVNAEALLSEPIDSPLPIIPTEKEVNGLIERLLLKIFG